MTIANTTEIASESAIVTPLSWTRRLPLKDLYPAPDALLEIDLGCGKGSFLIAKASKNSNINYLGIDRLLVRLQKAETKVRRLALANVRLLRVEVSYAVKYLLPQASVSVCYIFFPDPWPKRRHHRRRLINNNFLCSLNRAMCPGGKIHIATDHLNYFEEIRKCFRHHKEYEPTSTLLSTEDEQTEFERIFISTKKMIGRCSYTKASDTLKGTHSTPPSPRPEEKALGTMSSDACQQPKSDNG